MPSALVVGGLNVVGRNLVSYLVEKQLCHPIRVIDRSVPETAFLNERTREAFNKVEFLQVNLYNEAVVATSFEPAPGHDQWDYVFNCATEDRFGQVEQAYLERIQTVGINCAKEAAKRKVKVFVQLSTGCVYNETDENGPPCDEFAPTSGSSNCVLYHLKTDEQVLAMPGLNAIVVRPALIYGPGDFYRTTPFLALSTVIYHKQWKLFQPLTTSDPRRNSVHVYDVVMAMHHLAKWRSKTQQTGSRVYNIADGSDTHVSDMFAIYAERKKKQAVGTESTPSESTEPAPAEDVMDLMEVRDELNEMSGSVWVEMLQQFDIPVSPVSPFLSKDYFMAAPTSVDGQRIVKETGYEYRYPQLKLENLEAVAHDFVKQKLWPPVDFV